MVCRVRPRTTGSQPHLLCDNLTEMKRMGDHDGDIFMEDDSAFQKFNQADIDEILKSSSTKISYGEADEASGSVFSKAAFIADENAVDMDDPEFWTKILPEVRGRRPNPPNRARDPGC